ncbi:DNA-binding protein SATB2-like isoform X2 [Petromyzon marinus]|uniref:DNA-binding protein SATB2-like isoform X2 n=1 Tax=Petromyzon marinus TaxID=7757 RepID=UPI003F6E7559
METVADGDSRKKRWAERATDACGMSGPSPPPRSPGSRLVGPDGDCEPPPPCKGTPRAEDVGSGWLPLAAAPRRSLSRTLPLLCVVERGEWALGAEGPGPGEHVEFALVPREAPFARLPEAALLALGYSPSTATHASGQLRVGVWKPLPLGCVSDAAEATVGEMLHDVFHVLTLYIRLHCCPGLEDLPPGQWTHANVRCALQRLLRDSNQSALAKECPLSQSMISSIINGTYYASISSTKCYEFGQWYKQRKALKAPSDSEPFLPGPDEAKGPSQATHAPSRLPEPEAAAPVPHLPATTATFPLPPAPMGGLPAQFGTAHQFGTPRFMGQQQQQVMVGAAVAVAGERGSRPPGEAFVGQVTAPPHPQLAEGLAVKQEPGTDVRPDIYRRVREELKRASVSQAVFARVAFNRTQVRGAGGGGCAVRERPGVSHAWVTWVTWVVASSARALRIPMLGHCSGSAAKIHHAAPRCSHVYAALPRLTRTDQRGEVWSNNRNSLSCMRRPSSSSGLTDGSKYTLPPTGRLCPLCRTRLVPFVDGCHWEVPWVRPHRSTGTFESCRGVRASVVRLKLLPLTRGVSLPGQRFATGGARPCSPASLPAARARQGLLSEILRKEEEPGTASQSLLVNLRAMQGFLDLGEADRDLLYLRERERAGAAGGACGGGAVTLMVPPPPPYASATAAAAWQGRAYSPQARAPEPLLKAEEGGGGCGGAGGAGGAVTAAIYDEIQQEMKRAKVSQALFAKVAVMKSQGWLCELLRWKETPTLENRTLWENLGTIQRFLALPRAERDAAYQEEMGAPAPPHHQPHPHLHPHHHHHHHHPPLHLHHQQHLQHHHHQQQAGLPANHLHLQHACQPVQQSQPCGAGGGGAQMGPSVSLDASIQQAVNQVLSSKPATASLDSSSSSLTSLPPASSSSSSVPSSLPTSAIAAAPPSEEARPDAEPGEAATGISDEALAILQSFVQDVGPYPDTEAVHTLAAQLGLARATVTAFFREQRLRARHLRSRAQQQLPHHRHPGVPERCREAAALAVARSPCGARADERGRRPYAGGAGGGAPVSAGEDFAAFAVKGEEIGNGEEAEEEEEEPAPGLGEEGVGGDFFANHGSASSLEGDCKHFPAGTLNNGGVLGRSARDRPALLDESESTCMSE